MNRYNHNKLRQELHAAGASKGEARELLLVANKLQALKSVIYPKHRFWGRLAPLAASAFTFLLIGSSAVTFAQSSLPGNWLYPVKRLSENAAVMVNPNYRATVMMRRANEVNQLVNNHASSQTVLTTLADYKVEAAAYHSKDYAAYAYCKSALEQAATKATPHEHQMIAGILSNLRDVD